VKKYIELGSSLDILNKYSQGPVHLAAFYGLESIIVYLCKNLGLSTNDKDFSLRTPLHLAALEGRTNAAILLISLYENVNIVDAEGFTPLHLAVISQNYKIVRNLLIKNAKTDIKDLKGETPLTIAKNHEDASIIKLIVSINQEAQSSKRICDIYSKKISYEPNSYKKNLFYIFLFLLRAVIASCVLYNKLDLTLWVSSTGVLTLAFLFFIVSCIKNPGYAAIDKSENLLGLYEKYRGEFVCPYCECKKPSLARHCHACQRCVIVLDI
jgi:Ankyrin repeats (3 copies)